MENKEETNWTLILLICLLAIALFGSCSKLKTQPSILYSRMHEMNGTVTPWIVDVEGTFEQDTTIFIDSQTGAVEFKYTPVKPKN